MGYRNEIIDKINRYAIVNNELVRLSPVRTLHQKMCFY